MKGLDPPWIPRPHDSACDSARVSPFLSPSKDETHQFTLIGSSGARPDGAENERLITQHRLIPDSGAGANGAIGERYYGSSVSSGSPYSYARSLE